MLPEQRSGAAPGGRSRTRRCGRPPAGTSAQRLGVEVGELFVQTSRLTLNGGEKIVKEIISFDLFLVFPRES